MINTRHKHPSRFYVLLAIALLAAGCASLPNYAKFNGGTGTQGSRLTIDLDARDARSALVAVLRSDGVSILDPSRLTNQQGQIPVQQGITAEVSGTQLIISGPAAIEYVLEAGSRTWRCALISNCQPCPPKTQSLHDIQQTAGSQQGSPIDVTGAYPEGCGGGTGPIGTQSCTRAASGFVTNCDLP